MTMFKPPHPGEFIRDVYLEPFEISGRQLAVRSGCFAFHLEPDIKRQQRYQLGHGAAAVEDTWTIPRELVKHAEQL